MEEIIIATSNKGKVREAQEILKKFMKRHQYKQK